MSEPQSALLRKSPPDLDLPPIVPSLISAERDGYFGARDLGLEYSFLVRDADDFFSD